MENVDSNCVGRKSGGSRRTWKPYEERILMQHLKEMVASGQWKSDNGFRPGYLQKLEEKMRQSLPGTDIRAFPNINSKILTWKKHHGCLQLALGETGCGFNTSTNILDCTDTSWAKVIKKDPTVSGMRYKPWPYYADWLEVFGFDRAVGVPAMNLIDDAAEIEAEDAQAQVDAAPPSPIHVVRDEDEMEADSNEPIGDTSKAGAASQSSSKKRTHSQSFGKEDMIQALGEIFKASDERLVGIVKCIAPEPAPAPTLTCKDVFNMLETISDFSLDECLDAAELLSKNPRRLEMFTGFPTDARVRYVRRLLSGDFD